MHHLRQRRTAVAVGTLLTVAVTAAAPAAAAPRSPQAPAQPLVVNARWGGHCTYDRIVVDVRGKMPPVTVKRVKELRYDGSGKKVPLAGKYFLEIKLSPAAAHDEAGHSVYKGPKLKKISLPALKGIALTGDFEGVVTLGAAYGKKPVPKTFVLHSPERLVVDVPHSNSCR